MEAVTDFIFLGSKITKDGDYIHEIRRHLLLGRKVTMNLDSVLKSKDIALPTKVCIVVSYGLSSSEKGYESSTIKKAEHQIIDVFELCC